MENDLVTIVGSLNYDLIIKQKRLPYKGETFTGDALITSPGGKGANQAVQCSKLGLKTYMVGKVGSDTFGNSIIKSMQDSQVDAENVCKSNINTGTGIVHVMPDGDYYSTILTGANYDMSKSDIDKVENIIKKSKIVILQMEIPIEVIQYTISMASKYNCYIILNLAPPKKIGVDYLKKVDCLIVNETEASFLANQEITNPENALLNCEKLFKCVKSLLIITLGENGSVAFDGKEKLYVPAHKVTAVDATGAGDSFIGGIAYSIFHNMNIKESLEFATKISSISVTKLGGQSSFPCIGDIYYD